MISNLCYCSGAVRSIDSQRNKQLELPESGFQLLIRLTCPKMASLIVGRVNFSRRTPGIHLLRG